MREYKEVKETKKRQKLVQITCDLCGESATSDRWGARGYGVCEVEVRHKNGSSFPTGGFGEEYKVDICPECFMQKLIPWVESFGRVTVEPQDWDW